MRIQTVLSVIAAASVAACLPKPQSDGSETKIIGGVEVDPADPLSRFTVAIIIKRPGADNICTGSLISKYTILTANHCTPTRNPSDYQVVFGHDTARGTAIDVQQVIKMTGYDPGAPQNGRDLALLVMARPHPSWARPVAIVMDDLSNYSNHTVQIAGFGVTSSHESALGTAGLLRKTKTRIARNTGQGTMLFDSYNVNNSCWGDSGGPAVIGERDHLLMGVSSYVVQLGNTSCESGLSVYTNLGAHWRWVTDNMR